jgi:hypothetical protein
MCGISELFVGCTALEYCPRRLLLAEWSDSTTDDPPAAPEHDNSDYRSPFTRWDARASVRTSPRRELGPDDEDLFYSPHLVPLARHPLVRDLRPGIFQEVLVQRLYRYLDFTTKLEHLAAAARTACYFRDLDALDDPQVAEWFVEAGPVTP